MIDMSGDMPATLADMVAAIKGMPKEERDGLLEATSDSATAPWLPIVGPQTVAFFHEADEMLYGGAAGGGKTDLVLGLAMTAHERSLIFRRQATDLDGMWDRLMALTEAGALAKQQNSVKKRMVLHSGPMIEMGHLELPNSEKTWQGRDHDLLAFDEAAQQSEDKVKFVMQWVRSTTGHRCRVVFATNPPMPEMKDGVLMDASTGDWLARWFAPWIDDAYRDPAEVGELRWCFMVSEGSRLVTKWVEGPGWYDMETCEAMNPQPDDDERMAEQQAQAKKGDKKYAKARSRTFIRSLVQDNPFLARTGYAATLSSSPEPLRSMLMQGLFGIKMADHQKQVIPTNSVLAAQQRWRDRMALIEREHDQNLFPMLAIAADIAQGGLDSTVLAPLRSDNMFDQLKVYPGATTPSGTEVVTQLLIHRKNGALIILDAGGGYGGSTHDKLRDDHNIQAIMFNASHNSHLWTKNMMWKFLNDRAAMWWGFREALDPDSGEDIMLPPSDRLRAQLTAPHFVVKGNTMQVEAKEDVMRRLSGTSTDEADAVLTAWFKRETAIAITMQPSVLPVEQGGWNPGAQQRHRGDMSEEMDDPLANWG